MNAGLFAGEVPKRPAYPTKFIPNIQNSDYYYIQPSDIGKVVVCTDTTVAQASQITWRVPGMVEGGVNGIEFGTIFPEGSVIHLMLPVPGKILLTFDAGFTMRAGTEPLTGGYAGLYQASIYGPAAFVTLISVISRLTAGKLNHSWMVTGLGSF